MADISFSCPSCQQTIQVGEEFAGQAVKCSVCSGSVTVPTVPSAVSSPAVELPPPALDSGPSPFDFDAVSTTGTSPSIALDEATRSCWQNVATGIWSLWLGTAFQVLAPTTVLLVAILVFNVLKGIVVLSDAEELFPLLDLAAVWVIFWIVVVGAFLGTVLRLLGLACFLQTPAEVDARDLVVGALVCEITGLTGVGLALAGVILRWGTLKLPGALLAAGGVGTGLVILLLYLQRVASTLASRKLSAGLRHFVRWLLGGLAGFAATSGLLAFLWHIAQSSRDTRTETSAKMFTLFFLLLVLVLVLAPLTVLVKYLGLLNLTGDEVRKRLRS